MDRALIEIYKKQILIFLRTMNIYLGDTIVNVDERLNHINKDFIKKKMNQIYSGNLNENELNAAIDELMPYLFEKN